MAVLEAQVRTQLRQQTLMSGPALAAHLAISQPTLSRLLARMPEVVRLGRARATRYALLSPVPGEGSQWPVHRIDATGRPHTLGLLSRLHGDAFHFEPAARETTLCPPPFAATGVFPGLPWFLADQRPQGFLGRAFALKVGRYIHAPEELAHWQSGHVVAALLQFGSDAPGDLVLGDRALSQALRGQADTDTVSADRAAPDYPARADAALRGEVTGSSAGGEQPKFTATRRDADGSAHPVIVKFSERTGTASGRRWADLLIAEHVAVETLRGAGIDAAQTRLIEGDGRIFLESERFDRHPGGGRQGLVSLAALDAAFHGHGRIDWPTYADQLHREGWLGETDAAHLAFIGLFGGLIGNTDMHLGNASLHLQDARPLPLAPAYDMAPMLWRPSPQGELVPRAFAPPPPHPARLSQWVHAAQLATDYWRNLAQHRSVSDDFKAIARQSATVIATALDRFG